MAIYIGNSKLKSLYIGSQAIKEAYIGASKIYGSAPNGIYIDGVLADDVTLTTFSNYTGGGDVYTGNNVLRFGHSQGSFTSGSRSGRITFDFTNYNTITIKGYVKGWARYANSNSKIGIDTANSQVASGFPYTASAGAFSKTFDVSALTGNHSIVGSIYIDNMSGDTSTSAYNYMAITEITGE